MTDADLWSAWRIWMGVAAVVVLIAATLLVVIWLTARRSLADAVRALTVAEAIRAQTQPIWGLQVTKRGGRGYPGHSAGDRSERRLAVGGARAPDHRETLVNLATERRYADDL